ncbi:MAG TPA: IS481 family transposase, partial [Methanotrichaceae archaeon]|nr:IS481 family transposase [Methanotrichaceae archaeon]
MKLNKKRVHWLIHQKQKGVTSKDLAAIMKLSCRRVEQVWKYYQDTGQELPVGEKMGPPRKPFDSNEAEIVKEAYERYKYGARMLELIIKKVYKVQISHNRIHMYLLASNLAGTEPNKQKRRKWVRYEREHSMSAGHIDWHEDKRTGIKVCVIEDDASRKILAGGEFSEINTLNSILILKRLVNEYWWLCPLRELIMDHGSEFGAHRIHEDGTWNSEFKNQLRIYGIKPILARVKHPQTNGKLERWFSTYKRFRWDFMSFDEFIDWYNN